MTKRIVISWFNLELRKQSIDSRRSDCDISYLWQWQRSTDTVPGDRHQLLVQLLTSWDQLFSSDHCCSFCWEMTLSKKRRVRIQRQPTYHDYWSTWWENAEDLEHRSNCKVSMILVRGNEWRWIVIWKREDFVERRKTFHWIIWCRCWKTNIALIDELVVIRWRCLLAGFEFDKRRCLIRIFRRWYCFRWVFVFLTHIRWRYDMSRTVDSSWSFIVFLFQ